MRRRVSALLASLLVLTFSFSTWSNVCADMSHNSRAHAMSHSDTSSAPSHHPSTNDTGNARCHNLLACAAATGIVTAPDLSIDGNRTDGVAFHHIELRSSQRPLLDPPPPRA